MITIQDLYNIVGNKIAIEAQKALIRNNFPPQIAEPAAPARGGAAVFEGVLWVRRTENMNNWAHLL